MKYLDFLELCFALHNVDSQLQDFIIFLSM